MEEHFRVIRLGSLKRSSRSGFLRTGLVSAGNVSSLLGGSLAALSTFCIIVEVLDLGVSSLLSRVTAFYQSAVSIPLETLLWKPLEIEPATWWDHAITVWVLMAVAAFRTLAAARSAAIAARREEVAGSPGGPRYGLADATVPEVSFLTTRALVFYSIAIALSVLAWPLLIVRFHFRRPIYILTGFPNAPVSIARRYPNIFWGQMIVLVLGVLLLVVTNAGLGRA